MICYEQCGYAVDEGAYSIPGDVSHVLRYHESPRKIYDYHGELSDSYTLARTDTKKLVTMLSFLEFTRKGGQCSASLRLITLMNEF